MSSTEVAARRRPSRPTRPAAGRRATLAQAIAWLQAERIDEAQSLLSAWVAQAPDDADAQHFLGVALHAQGDSAAGAERIRHALRLQPRLAGAWNNLGNVLLEAGAPEAALAAYAQACALPGPEAARAHLNRAALHRQRGELEASEAEARRALALQPAEGDGWYQLARTLLAAGRVREGLDAHAQAVLRWPRAAQSRHQVLRALVLRGELAEAERLYREWLAEDPDNPVARHQLAACRAAQGLGSTHEEGPAATDDTPTRASDDYVRQVFDAYAPSFDAKLEALHYRAPQCVAEMLARLAPPPQAQFDVVDLGCGTGLCGPLLRPWVRHLAGCDLSVGMLRGARARGGYDVLHRAELVHYLATQPGRFDLAACADTLCYFGDLAPVAEAAALALRPQGLFIFTVEALPDTDPRPWALRAQGRYAHRAEDLRRTLAAHGFIDLLLEPATLREEAGEPVAGLIVGARRPGTG